MRKEDENEGERSRAYGLVSWSAAEPGRRVRGSEDGTRDKYLALVVNAFLMIS